MSTPTIDSRRKEPASPISVRVLLNSRGEWEVTSAGGGAPLRCESLDEARRVAYFIGTRRGPCELVVRDAYHRVLHRELIPANR